MYSARERYPFAGYADSGWSALEKGEPEGSWFSLSRTVWVTLAALRGHIVASTAKQVVNVLTMIPGNTADNVDTNYACGFKAPVLLTWAK